MNITNITNNKDVFNHPPKKNKHFLHYPDTLASEFS